MKVAEFAPIDPLAACLSMVASLLGRPASPEALKAGLPLENGQLTPDLAGRAAERASLEARVASVRLDELPPSALPAILILQKGGACVLTSAEGGKAKVLFPQAPKDARTMDILALSDLYSGRAILFRP